MFTGNPMTANIGLRDLGATDLSLLLRQRLSLSGLHPFSFQWTPAQDTFFFLKSIIYAELGIVNDCTNITVVSMFSIAAIFAASSAILFSFFTSS